jgi:MarR-like DNA-binding transcriptional regulator SgrR of sgrS sRNA
MKKALSAAVLSALLFGCNGEEKDPGIPAVEEPAADGTVETEKKEAEQVVLAYEKTRFKKALVEKMKELLEADGITVKVTEHSKKDFDLADPSIHKAVFITNSGVHSKVRPWITEWLETHKAAGDMILLHTTQKSDWEVEADVDTVTSASYMDEIDSLAAEFVKQLKSRIPSEPETP